MGHVNLRLRAISMYTVWVFERITLRATADLPEEEIVRWCVAECFPDEESALDGLHWHTEQHLDRSRTVALVLEARHVWNGDEDYVPRWLKDAPIVVDMDALRHAHYFFEALSMMAHEKEDEDEDREAA